MRSRLYGQIYVAFVGVIVLCIGATALLAVTFFERPEPEPVQIARVIVRTLPDPGDPAFDEAFAELSDGTGAALELWDPDGATLARTGDPLPAGEPGWFRSGGWSGVRMPVADGRMLALAVPIEGDRRVRLVALLSVLALAIGVGCWPLARRLSRRLEDLSTGVAAWGDDLDARLPVAGRDEIAAVALAFNVSADRVQQLVEAQQRTLASVSHELRSPLARIRMALALLDDDVPERSALVADATRDVEELDRTVGELLQVGRLQAGTIAREPVDLRALALVEAARVGAAVEGAATWTGDATLLRRLLRNLLENAARYGAPPITVTLSDDGLAVADRGPGVPEALRERVFEPFYRPDGHAEGRDGGVGLGLWLVRSIARAHGGSVRCEPRPDGGTRFRVTLTPG